ncbi:hypothetical protein ACFL4Y_03565 [Gemmatimonadota bacterium]
MREFEGQVSEEEIQALHAEVGDGPDFIYHPHWDALYGIAWSERLGRFVMMLFIG